MKLCNINVENAVHLAVIRDGRTYDLTASGFSMDMDAVIASGISDGLRALCEKEGLPEVVSPVYANVVNRPGKLVCVGLNYRSHADGVKMTLPDHPILFSKFANALAPANAKVDLPSWEESYDYEAELVIVIGKSAWDVSEAEAADCIFGYTCGNDFSCRAAQSRSSQWLIGKTMPGFGPCGPCITTSDSLDPEAGIPVRSFVNGQLRQDGTTADMLFSCRRIVSYASHYIKLEPGDLIFTGTPGGVALEEDEDSRSWLVPGDVVEVEIGGIGTLTNYMV